MKNHRILNIFLIMLLMTVLLGCANTAKKTNDYKDLIDEAKKVTTEAEFQSAKTAQEAYYAENGTYANGTDELEAFGDIPDGLTVAEADENNFTLKLKKNGKVYTYSNAKN